MDTLASTPQAVASVIAVEGQAFARNPAGELRPLKAGDVLLEGDTVVTSPGGRVQLALADGERLNLLPNESFTFTAETSPHSRPAPDEAALAADDAERIIQALERGEDIDAQLEETAAGLEGGGNNQGNDFVRLLRIVEGVSPLAFEFGTGLAPVEFPIPGGDDLNRATVASEPPARVTLSADASVVEGGSIVYTASVDRAPAGSPLVLTLSNGATITIPVGATSGSSAPVPVRSDDVYAQGSVPVSASVVSASGGNYPALDLGSPASTLVSDDSDVTTVSLAATPSVAEGGSILYTATLDQPAASTVTVTLSNGAVITIAAGDTSGSVNFAAPGDDVYVDAVAVSATISSASGGGFESLAINPAAALTSISDTLDTTTLNLSAAPSVSEGGSVVYTASVDHPVTGSALDITLSNGLVIQIPVGATSASASVTAPDDLYLGGGSLSVTVSGTSGGNYESLLVGNGAPGTPVVTTVTDDNDATPVSLSATPLVLEGGNIVYTATLGNPAQTPVIVNLSSGAVITIAAGATSGTVSVPAPGDDVYLDAGSVSASITSASGGNFEALTVDSTPATTMIDDTPDTTTVSLAASSSVAEGGFITYTATLTHAAQSTVTVNLSNGFTISIAAGATSGTVDVAAPGDDVYLDGSTVSATITSAAGGNFESLVIDPAAAATTITDTIDTATVSLTASPSVNEGGMITYTASLTHPAQSDVTVTLSNGTTLTILAGTASGSANAPAPADDVYADAGTVSASIVSATGGNFENLAINATPATTVVSDTPDATTITLSASPSVAEGSNITYTATLSSAAQSNVNVTLSNGATLTILAGTSSGFVDVPAPADDVYLDASSVAASISTATGGGFESLVINPAGVTTTITDTINVTTVSLTGDASVTEGGTAHYTLALTSPAQGTVTITLAYSGTALDGTDYTGITTISIPDGASSANFSLATLDDALAEGTESLVVSISTASGGNFENLLISGTNHSVTTSLIDNDTATVSLSATPTLTEAGGTLVYTASLTQVPVSDLTVTLSNGQTITILAGQTSASVSVPLPADEDVYRDAGAVSASITGTSGGGFTVAIDPTPAVTTITDTLDTTTVSLAASPSVAEGGTITYTATLTHPAQTNVTVTLSNGATITIMAGNSAGTVNVAAPADDVYVDASTVTATITAAVGGNFENLAVNATPAVTTITDTPDTATVSLAASPSVAEGGNITYTASLTHPALTGMSVTLSNGSVINIAAGATSGTVSLAAPGDDVYLDASTVSASIASTSGGNFENLAINATPATTSITDTINTTTVSLTASPSVAEGGNITYTASLTSPAQTNLSVTLSNGAVITILAGAATGSISVAAPADDVYVDAGSVIATITAATGGNFESLAINPAAATTSITDTINTTTVSLTASPSVAEGGNITYTASLTSPAQSAVSVTLSNGASITIAAGASSGSVSVVAPSDDVYLDASSVSATITAATGGNFESLAINPAAATTSITDTINTTTVSLTASPSVAEGGNITYTASLTSPAQSTVTLTLSNGANITITAGNTAGTVDVPAPADDVYLDASSVSANITSATGGNFESLAINPAAATTSITDTINTTTVSLTASPSVAEGGSITYTASLNNPAQSAVSVTLSNGSVIGIAAGASSGSISVAAPSDDVYLDASSVSANITSATGGNFESLAINPAAATTSITDTINTTTVSLTASPSVAEGGNITYTASLTSPAQSAVSVTLSNGASITIAAGASSGSVSVVAPSDDVYLDASSVSATITAATGGNFESLAINPAAATTSITDTINTTTVSLTASPSVAEGGNIAYTASLTSPAQTNLSVTLSNGAVITILAGAATGSVSVAAPADDVYVDAGSVSATITAASGGNFENLAINAASATTAITDTINTTTVSLTASPSVTEGGSITYTASLTSPAQSAVSVTLSNGASITIAAGASSGSVSVAAPSDDVYLDASSVSANITAATGGNFESLTINPAAATTSITDTINTATVSLTGDASVNEGASAGYTLALTHPAQGNVTVTLAYSGTAANGSDFTGTTTVTIPNGASSANFSVATLDDTLAEGSENFTISLISAAGGNFENLVISGSNGSVTTTLLDNDASVISLSATPSLTEAGGTLVYTATATQPPVSDMTVTLSNGATLTILAGQTSGSVNVPLPASDDVYLDASSISATITATSGGSIPVSIDPTPAVTSINDTLDTTTVSLTATPSVAEGGSITYTASLTSPAQSAVSVTLSNGATITIAAGASSGSVSVAAPTDDVYLDASSVSATITAATGGNFESLAINPAAATTSITDTNNTTTVSLTASPSVAEGGNITYTATLTNPAQTPVSVTLNNGVVITIAAGTTTGSATGPAPSDDVYLDAGNVSTQIATATGGNFESLFINPAAATTSITDTINTTTVSLKATPSVAEGGNITYTASLTSPAQSAVSVTLSNGSVIGIAAGASSGSISVAAPSDDVYLDASSVSATITAATGGNFESLAINPAAAATSITDTINTTTVSLTASPSVAEGGNITYTASLTSPAQSAVSVTLSNGASITISAGASSGSVSVVAPSDDVYLDASSVSATITAATGGNFESLAINPAAATTSITDTINTTTVSLTASPSVAEGGTITYTASLTSVAQSTVTVTLSNGTTITIAAGNASGSASVAAPSDDVYLDAGAVSATITAATGGNFESLAINPAAATTSITDTLDTVLLSLTGDSSVNEGASAGYTLALTHPAQGNVTVTLAYSGTAANGSDFTGTATVTIPNGASSANFSIATINDTLVEGAESFTVTIATASGGNFENLVISGGSSGANSNVTTTVVDNDTTTLSVSSPSVEESAGYAQFTVSLSNLSSQSTSVSLALANGTAGANDYGPALEVSTNGGASWTPATSAVIPAGQASILVRTPINNDRLDEANETFTLTATRTAGTPVTNPGGTASGTGTILDGDTTPVLDLDANNSSGATGSQYQTSFTENGPAVSLGDVDVSVSDADGNAMTGATIRLTNAQAGDLLSVGGLPAGISAVVNTSVAGQITVTLTGTASQADYQAAIRAVSFSNGSDAPSTVNRTVTVSVTDGFNASNTATTTITVNPVNDPPVAQNVSASGSEDPAAPIPVTLTGSDVDGTVSNFMLANLPPNGTLYRDAAMTQPVSAGSVLAAAGNSLTLYFRPPVNWNGTTDFNYTATDNQGAVSVPATATINIAAVDDGAPVAGNDAFTTALGTPIVITRGQLLANDSLPDNAQITNVGAVSGGTLVYNGNDTWTYTPASIGSANFTYTLTDEDGQTTPPRCRSRPSAATTIWPPCTKAHWPAEPAAVAPRPAATCLPTTGGVAASPASTASPTAQRATPTAAAASSGSTPRSAAWSLIPAARARGTTPTPCSTTPITAAPATICRSPKRSTTSPTPAPRRHCA